MQVRDLTKGTGEWLRGVGPKSDVVISSRIRLARNVVGFPFLTRCNARDRQALQARACTAIAESHLGPAVEFVDLQPLRDIDRQLLVERHLISKPHAALEGARGVALSQDETLSIMVNEEDHLRIQALRSGLQLVDAWAQINQIDDQLEQRLHWSFHPRFGYLTACPTNVGTGIRVSVMLHLPALKLTGEIEKVFRAAKELRLAVRGLYGEGTEPTGDFYQVSNQTTLGRTEEQLLEQFEQAVVPRIIEYEQHARRMLLNERTVALDDKIFRAMGLLRNARLLTGDEALFLLSHVRLGVHLERIRDIDMAKVNELFLLTQPAHLQMILGKELDGDQRRAARAHFIRQKLGAG